MQYLEYFRQHLDRVGTARACDLNDEDDYRDRFAEVSEGENKAVVYEREQQACDSRGQPVPEGAVALDADVEQIAEHGEQRCELADSEEDDESSEESLC